MDGFDLNAGLRAKEQGMLDAATKPGRQELLELARSTAKAIALKRDNRQVTVDDVGRTLKGLFGINSLGKWGGSIFKPKEWEFTGKYKRTARISSHAREVKVWRYVG